MSRDERVGMWIFLPVIGAFLLLIIGLACDLSTSKIEGGYARVMHKCYIPPKTSTTTRYDSVHEQFVTETTTKPEQWIVFVVFKKEYIKIETTPELWDIAKDNEPIGVATSVGGFTGLKYGYRIVPSSEIE